MPRPRKIRAPEKGRLSDRGVWSLNVGQRPYSVTAREDRKPGARVILDYFERGNRRQVASGVETVRDGTGQFDAAAITRVEALALEVSAKLRLSTLRDDIKPQGLTVGQAFEMYFDPERGGLAPSKSSRNAGNASRVDWSLHLGEGTPWNAVRPTDVDAMARKWKRAGHAKTAEQRVKWLRTVYNWLRKRARIRGLEDPTEHFDFQALMEGYEPRQPRFTSAEADRIVASAWDVDPRFRLMIALMDDSVVRRVALIRTWRSAIDRPLNMPPSAEDAPHGWIVFPAMKGQPAVPWFLTAFQRREIDMALTTHLSELERLYQSDDRDYPLFPAARMYEKAREERRPINPTMPGAYRPVGEGLTEKWLRAAEREAGIEHVPGRLWHGLRRTASDVVYDAAGLSVLTTAGGWQNQTTPGKVYVGKARNRDRAVARNVMEKKRARNAEKDVDE